MFQAVVSQFIETLLFLNIVNLASDSELTNFKFEILKLFNCFQLEENNGQCTMLPSGKSKLPKLGIIMHHDRVRVDKFATAQVAVQSSLAATHASSYSSPSSL